MKLTKKEAILIAGVYSAKGVNIGIYPVNTALYALSGKTIYNITELDIADLEKCDIYELDISYLPKKIIDIITNKLKYGKV